MRLSVVDPDLIFSLELRLIDLEKKVDDLKSYLAEPINADNELPLHVLERLKSGESPVRVLRQFRMMTQKNLGELCGVRANHISAIERGQGFGVKMARKLADALDVRPSVLM